MKEAGDVETMMKLNELISNRPDMTQYMQNSSGYLAQLDEYADAAVALLQQSDRQYQAGLAVRVHKPFDEDPSGKILNAIRDEGNNVVRENAII